MGEPLPHYTTSYSNNKKPRYRRNAGPQLPNARRRQTKRRGGQYLRHSQGFSGRNRSGRGYGASSRKPYAIIMVGCAFLFFLATVIWYANRSVDITLNGEKSSIRINSSIDRIITDKELDLKAGNLLAVDDSVLEKGGGERCAVKLNGKKVKESELSTVELSGGEKLEISDGGDVYEDHDVAATEIQPTLSVEGTGAIQYVKTWGVPGRSEVWTGKESGKTQDRGVVREKVDCVVECTSVSPDDRDKNYVALTFDEGPSANTQQVLDALDSKGVKATFFLSGDKAEENASAAKAIAKAGHDVGTNAYSDTNLEKLTGEDLRSQLTRGFDAVEKASGKKTALLRPPYGTFSEQNWAESMDMVSAAVTWNVDSGDWLLKGAQSVIDNVMGSVSNGDIILLTDNDATSEQLVELLPGLIDRLQSEGYTILPLSKLVETDEELSKELHLNKVSMPKDAVLPQLPSDDADAAGSADGSVA